MICLRCGLSASSASRPWSSSSTSVSWLRGPGTEVSSSTMTWPPPRLSAARRRACSTRIQRIARAEAARKWSRSDTDRPLPWLIRRNSSCTSTVGVMVDSAPRMREPASRLRSGYRASNTAPSFAVSPLRASASNWVMSVCCTSAPTGSGDASSAAPADANPAGRGRLCFLQEADMHDTRRDEVLIIGGGHNGLVCAAYLAGAGLKVRVLERRRLVGGAAVTEEFHPGFRNSVASYTVSLLNPAVIRDLRLHEHGLRVVERPYANFLPLPDGRSFRLGGEHTQAEVAK